jgi:N-acylneuraminate cytidylyltransferase
MVKAENYIALIPVRGGSVSIPGKNIKHLNGRPLLYWTLDAAVGCDAIDAVYVSSDSDSILSVAAEYGSGKVVCVKRDPQLATGTASTESVMGDFARTHDFRHMVLVQATSPMLTSGDLDSAIAKYESGGYDSVLSVVRQKRFVWQERDGIGLPINYHPSNRPMRQSFQGYLVENGAFYVTSKEALLESGVRVSGKIGLAEMSEDSYFEIDEPADWDIAEALVGRKKAGGQPLGKFAELGANIALFATDVDGVLTDGGMYYSNSGDSMKRFDTRDGKGFAMLREAGIKTAIITGESTGMVAARAQKIKADYLLQGIDDKLPELRNIANSMGISMDQVAYIGDDLNDVECIKAAGIGMTVPGACAEALRAAAYVTKKRGGSGAVREAIECILAARRKE